MTTTHLISIMSIYRLVFSKRPACTQRNTTTIIIQKKKTTNIRLEITSSNNRRIPIKILLLSSSSASCSNTSSDFDRQTNRQKSEQTSALFCTDSSSSPPPPSCRQQVGQWLQRRRRRRRRHIKGIGYTEKREGLQTRTRKKICRGIFALHKAQPNEERERESKALRSNIEPRPFCRKLTSYALGIKDICRHAKWSLQSNKQNSPRNLKIHFFLKKSRWGGGRGVKKI